MDPDILDDRIQMKRSEQQVDAEFEQHNVNIEEILSRTQRSFGSRTRRCVYEAPEFIKRLNAFEEVTVGETVIFECQWRAFPQPTIKWYKDDEEITEDPRYQIETEHIQNGVIRLLVKDARKKDEGAYKCKAENQEGVASTTGYLSVSGGSDNYDRTLATKQKEQQQDKKKLPADFIASSAPHLRTIIEQQSVEEREAESLRDQPPSPIQDFIDKVQSGRARGVTWPYLSMACQNGFYTKADDDAESSGSDTSINSQDYDDVSFSIRHEDDIFTDKIPSQELELLGCQVDKQADDISSSKTDGKMKGEANLDRTMPAITTTRTDQSRQGLEKQKQEYSGREAATKVNVNSLHLDKLLDILDSKWIYFLPFVSSMTFFASAMEASPFFLILPLMFISFVMFYVLLSEENT